MGRFLGLVGLVSAHSVPPGAERTNVERTYIIKIAQDVLPITMLDVSGAAEIEDDPSQPYNRVGVSAAAISYVDIAIMCSDVVCGWELGRRMFDVVVWGRFR